MLTLNYSYRIYPTAEQQAMMLFQQEPTT
ncbi:MAG: helix-turn-helix domain-containing protein [Xenococcus sp. (in: cyanobacteria)]